MARWWVRVVAVLLLFVVVWSAVCAQKGREGESSEDLITLPMPDVSLEEVRHNDYRCTWTPLPHTDAYIVEFEPRANAVLIHHMILFGCRSRPLYAQESSWSCKSTRSACGDRHPTILFAWALNASGLQLPEGVGRGVGPSHNINYAILQLHYGEPEAVSPQDVGTDALVLHLTNLRQPYIAGIYFLGSGLNISPGEQAAHVDTACEFPGPKSIYPFAYRTHAHSLGQVIAGYVVKDHDNWTLIGSRSPQDAQAFYPAVNHVEIDQGDWVAAQCVFNTVGKTETVHMGANSEDEMCNFYIMYYTRNDGNRLTSDECWEKAPPSLTFPKLHVPAATVSSSPIIHNHTDTSGTPGNVSETSEVEEKDDYVCPSPVPPGPPSQCRTPGFPTTVTPTGGPGGKVSSEPTESSHPPTLVPSEVPNTPEKPSSATEATNEPQQVTKRPFFEGEDNSGSDENRTLESELFAELQGLVLAEDWPLNGVSSPEIQGITLGQVSAVTVDQQGFVHVLHRGTAVWDYSSFHVDHTYRHIDQGPVGVSTILKLSSDGKLVASWGKNMFYLPHGLTIDSQGSFWITDVALHQVFKFTREGASVPSLELGRAFVPGKAWGFFCKPTTVAVEESGMFYVADGYCNNRILKFNPHGIVIAEWSQPVDGVHLLIPHSLALSQSQQRLFVADRENGRILSYDSNGNGQGEVFSSSHALLRVFAISFNGSGGWPMFVISAPSNVSLAAQGIIVTKEGEISSIWGLEEDFSRPHDVAVAPGSSAVYVAEIGPNRIWKFIPVGSAGVHTVEKPASVMPTVPAHGTHSESTSTTAAVTTHTTTATEPDSTATTASSTEHSNTTEATESSPTSSSQPSSVSPETSGGSQPPTETLDTQGSNFSVPSGENASLPDVPFSGGQNTSDDNETPVVQVLPSSSDQSNHPTFSSSPSTHEKAAYEYGIFITIFALAAVIILLAGAILIRSKYCLTHEWSIRKPSTNNPDPKKTLHSLLGPSQLGFSRLRTYDSDSEVDEFPIFSRV